MFSSYQKQALTVMISPLCTNCHDITVILLNVELNTINLTLYLQRHIPTYLYIYIFIRIIDFIQFFASYFPMLMSFKGLGAIRARIGPTSNVDKIFSKMYSQYVLFRNKYS